MTYSRRPPRAAGSQHQPGAFPLDRRALLQLVGGASASLVVGCGGAAESSARSERPTPSPMSRDGLQQMHDRLAAYVTAGTIPGLVALVARGDQVHVDAIGTLALGSTAAVGRDSIFRIASMTKPVTAAAAMMLVEDGVLRLDEPVDRLLPELANRRVLRRPDGPLDDTEPARRPILVRDLLAFTMGFGIVFAPPGSHPIQVATDKLELGQGMPGLQKVPAPDEWIRRLGTLPLIHQPGARWMYHTGADVLGVLIARAAGTSLEAFLRERIFAPLAMKDTGFWVPTASRDRLVTSYVVDPATDTMTAYDGPDGRWSAAPAFPSGGGGLVSTVDDFLAFGRMLLAGGEHAGRRLLSTTSVDMMTSDQLTADQKAASRDLGDYFDSHGWGLGMAVVTGRDIAGAPGAFGWDGGLGTTWRSDPKRQAVTILLTQRAWTSPTPPPVCNDFWTTAAVALGA